MANVKKTERFKDYLLSVLALAGTITLASVTPGLMVAIGKVIGKKQFSKKEWSKKKAKRSLYYLERLKLISYSEDQKGNLKVQLTKRGKEEIENRPVRLGQKIQKPKHWDGKWQLVIFDIPESKRKNRDLFRKELKMFGFVQIGKSEYIYPFDCETEINFLRNSLLITPYVKLLVVVDFEGVGKLKKKFNLS